METPALNDLSARVRGGGGVKGAFSLELVMGQLSKRLAAEADREREMQRAVQTVLLPAVQYTVTGGAPVVPQQSGLMGPEDGQVWDVRRLTVAGLSPAATQSAGVAAGGNVTNPGANTTIISLAALSPGLWQINWSVGLQGTVTAADANNMRLRSNATTIATAEYPGLVGNYPQPPVQVNVPAGAGLTLIQSVAAASGASAIYTGSLSATPLFGGDAVALYREIPGAGNGQPENFLHLFTAASPSWSPGGGLVLRSPEQLLLAGTGLLAATVTLSGEAVAVAAPWLSRYLL